MKISGRTRVAAVLGDPVEHSLSPAMHNAAFRAVGFDGAYVAFHVPAAGLRAAVHGLQALGALGCNVTVPHKEAVARLVGHKSEAATRTGAVNTVVCNADGLYGDNTDAYGFTCALTEAGRPLRGARVVLIGAGGASRAALFALSEAGAAEVVIANRTLRRAVSLARTFATARTSMRAVGLDQLAGQSLLGPADLVVNTSSLGLRGEPFVPLAVGATSRHCLFFELIPKRTTAFLQLARDARRPRLDGMPMLLHQGAAAFRQWTGCEPPIDVMRRALAAAARQRT